MGTTTLTHPFGDVDVVDLPGGDRDVRVRARAGVFVSRERIVTTYPVDLVAEILAVKGPGYVCDEIARHEDPAYVRKLLEHDLDCYFPRAAFEGARIVDFGCGCGASTMILADMYPRAAIVGVELLAEHVRIAEARKRLLGKRSVECRRSPSGVEVPLEEGAFDFVILSAVLEHLLPEERRALMPQLWRALRPGGKLFLNQTPHRLFPVELHTTGLPLINYLPDAWAGELARRFSPRVDRGASWEELLRAGIRGATDAEILDVLGPGARLVEPSERGCHDRLDVWYTGLGPRHRGAKRAVLSAMRLVHRVTGVVFTPSLSAAFEKRPAA
jgi:SAM-dependent methyltransferase